MLGHVLGWALFTICANLPLVSAPLLLNSSALASWSSGHLICGFVVFFCFLKWLYLDDFALSEKKSRLNVRKYPSRAGQTGTNIQKSKLVDQRTVGIFLTCSCGKRSKNSNT